MGVLHWWSQLNWYLSSSLETSGELGSIVVDGLTAEQAPAFESFFGQPLHVIVIDTPVVEIKKRAEGTEG